MKKLGMVLANDVWSVVGGAQLGRAVMRRSLGGNGRSSWDDSASNPQS